MKKIFTFCFIIFACFSAKISAQSYDSDFGWLSETRLNYNDISGRTADELSVMRDAIYAKYGYAFDGSDMYEYFSQFDWYNPTGINMTVAFNSMNPVEQYNIGFINLNTESQGKVLTVQYGMSYPSWLINRKLSMSDIAYWNCWELRVYRNAIYAVNGYIFKSADLRDVFYSCSWYRPNTKSEKTAWNRMSSVEQHNVNLIKKREKQLGC